MSLPPDDLSNIPRGAIGIRGIPVSRNARLPSIRTPRDLTLGAQKRTFVPNIPVRREKRTPDPSADTGNASSEVKPEKDNKFSPKVPDRGRGRGRGRGQIIQMKGSVFGEGIAASSNRGKQRESASQRSSFSSGRASAMKKENLDMNISDISRDMDSLMRDDFIDDGDDDKHDVKPVTFPLQDDKSEKTKLKSESKDTKENFKNQDFAKEMGFDVKKIAKFIKKEKADDDLVKPTAVTATDLPKNEISELVTSDDAQILLLRFPECITSLSPEYQQKGQTQKETTPSNDQQKTFGNVCSLPEGHIGKLQILKSGQTRLVMGSLYYDLDSVTPLRSKHEVASIDVEANSGDIIHLANVNTKLSFAPNVQNVLS